MSYLEDLKMSELKQIAVEKGLPVIFSEKKVDLIRRIIDIDTDTTKDVEPKEKTPKEVAKEEVIIFFTKLGHRKAGTSTEAIRMIKWYNILYDKHLAECASCTTIISQAYHQLLTFYSKNK